MRPPRVSGTFVVNGSPTQTAMADRAGARSQIAQLALAGVVLVGAAVPDRPAAVSAALRVGQHRVHDRGRDDRRRGSARSFAAKARASFILPSPPRRRLSRIGVEQGILLAIALSLFRHVRHSYRPHTMMLAPNATGRWVPVPATPGTETEPGLIVYRFGSDLFYANANRFADEVRALVEQRADAGPLVDGRCGRDHGYRLFRRASHTRFAR